MTMRILLQGAGTGLLIAGLFLGLYVRFHGQPACAADNGREAQGEDLRLSGPYTHENLTVFLVYGRDRLETKELLTLQEALVQKKAVVHEKEDVNELTVEVTVHGGSQERPRNSIKS
jgi:hypothetical protein